MVVKAILPDWIALAVVRRRGTDPGKRHGNQSRERLVVRIRGLNMEVRRVTAR